MEWYEKYATNSFEEIVLPTSIRTSILRSYEEGVKHFLFYSRGPGTGKTSLANVIAAHTQRELRDFDAGSSDANKSNIETTIKNFSGKTYIFGKIVIINEGHRLTRGPQGQQSTLVGLLDKLSSKNTSLIITTNNLDVMDEYLKSRMTVIDFNYDSEEHRNEVMPGFKSRLIEIATAEGYKYNEEVIDELIQDNFPSMRDMVKDMQFIALSYGTLEKYIKPINVNINIFKLLQEKDFNEAFKELAINGLVNERVYGYVTNLLKGSKMSKTKAKIIRLAKTHAYYHGITCDKETNIYSFLLDLAELVGGLDATSKKQ